MKARILSVSLSPAAYDIREIAKMTFDEAKSFFESDTIGCCNYRDFVIDMSKVGETRFHADGVYEGDGSDTVLNWLKVYNDKSNKQRR